MLSHKEKQRAKCSVPENIHTPPTEGIGISWGVGGSGRPKSLKRCRLYKAYRIYLNKRRGAYLIFRATSAALIPGQRLFEGGAYLNIVPDKCTFSLFLFNGTLSIC